MDLRPVLDRSLASDAFKADVLAFAAHRPAPKLTVGRPAPRIKVLRVIAQLLHAEPELRIESAHVDGIAGCADFRGTVTVACGGSRRSFDFLWDCQWRAIEEGWVDAFGFPDQIRAADTFGWQCFSHWRERALEGFVMAGAGEA